MKIGVKTFNDPAFLKYFEDKVDFFEIMALQKNNYAFIKEFSLPIVIHAEHQRYGVNIADSTKKEFNLKSINFARKVADSVNAKKIIIHSGVLEDGNKNCSIENSIKLFQEIDDNRIILENLPKNETFPIKGTSVGFSALKMKKLLKLTGKGFCFDVNHAFWTRKKMDGNYSFIKKYIELNPFHYHIGGQKLELDNHHTPFENSDFDLKEVLKYYPKDACITIETETNINSVDKDVEILKEVIEELEN